MKLIVIELQEMSSDENIPITALIRKALIVASKLNLSDFKKWIEKEINGDYRTRDGSLFYRENTRKV